MKGCFWISQFKDNKNRKTCRQYRKYPYRFR